MNLLRSILALAVLTAGIAAHASISAPYIDPKLRPLFNGESTSRQPVTVIAIFQDKLQIPEYVRSNSYSATRIAMMKNSLKSQERAAQILRTTEARNEFKQLWIINGMLIRMAAKDIRRVATLPGVTKIYANHSVRLIDEVNARRVSRAEMADPYTYGLVKLGIPTIREKLPTLTGKGVRVGILDTGIDPNHADLKGKVVLWKDFTSNPKNEPYDDNKHGTHCAGTIAGGAASGTAIGVAPEASLVIAKFLDGGGSGTWEGALSSMQWLADPDGNPNTADAPHLISNSWGGSAPDADEDPADNLLCVAVGNWVKVGILPVFANGNAGPSSGSVGLPGGCPNAMGVGATDKNDKIANFSSRGPAIWKTGSFVKPEVSAPGKDIISSVPGGGYASLSGTSMATPHVAGMAALVFQFDQNMKAEQVANLMMKSAFDLGTPGMDNDYGTGRIDAVKALAPLVERYGRP